MASLSRQFELFCTFNTHTHEKNNNNNKCAFYDPKARARNNDEK